MLINAVCRECGLTKKAVEYYIEQGLVAPSVQENGYRDFSDADLARLKKISVLRGLGLSVADIQGVLADLNLSLNDILHQKDLEISILQEKQELMQELARTQDWDNVQGKLVQLRRNSLSWNACGQRFRAIMEIISASILRRIWASLCGQRGSRRLLTRSLHF